MKSSLFVNNSEKRQARKLHFFSFHSFSIFFKNFIYHFSCSGGFAFGSSSLESDIFGHIRGQISCLPNTFLRGSARWDWLAIRRNFLKSFQLSSETFLTRGNQISLIIVNVKHKQCRIIK